MERKKHGVIPMKSRIWKMGLERIFHYSANKEIQGNLTIFRPTWKLIKAI